MHAISKDNQDFLYRQVLELVTDQVDNGALKPGDRLPSLRKLSQRLNVSIPTVRQAYLELERQDVIEARPKSGYFIQAQRRARLVQSNCRSCRPMQVKCRNLIDQVYDGIHRPGVLPLGIANPSMALPATKTLHRAMKRVMSRAEERTLDYAPTTGDSGLKRQIAYRYGQWGCNVSPDEIIITNGAQEALALALKSVAVAGDIIAVESPCYHGALELIESLGMLALEIETCPVAGVSLAALSQALDSHPVKACLFSSSLCNPLGCLSSNGLRRKLTDLLQQHGIPLIEDDVYGELIFDGQRPTPAFFHGDKVLSIGSFSKTAAPGYRIGWLLPGSFYPQAEKLKRAVSCSSGLLQQLTLTEFMASGDYDRYLARLVPTLKQNAQRMIAAISRSFPTDIGISDPKGGSVLWIELPQQVDSGELFKLALDHNISIVPGTIFAAGDRFRNYIRLSYGHPWDQRMEDGIATLGQLLKIMLD